MNWPGRVTTEMTVVRSARAFKWLERIALLGGVALAFAFALGFKIEKPGERLAGDELAISAIAKRLTTLEENTAILNAGVAETNRLQCLLMSRHDAILANACKLYPTRDESTRAVR